MLRRGIIKRTFQTALGSALILASCFILFRTLPSSAEKVASKHSNAVKKTVNNSKFHKQLLEIAAEYQSYGKVDDMARWAPWLCAFPPPPKARLSQSKDLTTHGKKLYYLFAKHRNSYMENEINDAGQAVVKEAWLPPSDESVKAAKEDWASKKGKAENPALAFEPDVLGPKSGLYIMYNTGSKTADTDDGWIYGTVTADGKSVTSAGRVESCMSCHVNAPHGRLFGLQK